MHFHSAFGPVNCVQPFGGRGVGRGWRWLFSGLGEAPGRDRGTEPGGRARVKAAGRRGAQQRGGEGRAEPRRRTACTRPHIRKALGTFQEQRAAREAQSRGQGEGVLEEGRPSLQARALESSVLFLRLFPMSVFLCDFLLSVPRCLLPYSSPLSLLCLFLLGPYGSQIPLSVLTGSPPRPRSPSTPSSLSICLFLSPLLAVSQDRLGCGTSWPSPLGWAS